MYSPPFFVSLVVSGRGGKTRARGISRADSNTVGRPASTAFQETLAQMKKSDTVTELLKDTEK